MPTEQTPESRAALYAAFDAAVAHESDVRHALSAARQRFDAEFRAEGAERQRLRKKAKLPPTLPEADVEALRAEFLQRAAPVVTPLEEAHKASVAALKTTAAATPYSLPEERVAHMQVAVVHSSAYSTQGFGARRYAEGSAAATLARWLAAGFEGTSTWEDFPIAHNPHGLPYGAATVTVVASPRDVLVHAHRPTALTLREEMKVLLKAGCNVRVFNPYLPHDFEAKLGLSYTGEDLPGYTPPAASGTTPP